VQPNPGQHDIEGAAIPNHRFRAPTSVDLPIWKRLDGGHRYERFAPCLSTLKGAIAQISKERCAADTEHLTGGTRVHEKRFKIQHFTFSIASKPHWLADDEVDLSESHAPPSDCTFGQLNYSTFLRAVITSAIPNTSLRYLDCCQTSPYRDNKKSGCNGKANRVTTRKSKSLPSKGKKPPASKTLALRRAGRNPNEYRRKRGKTGYEEVWADFIDQLEKELASLSMLRADVRRSPFYSTPNVVKRAVYIFVEYARKKLKPQPLEDTIDKSRVDKAGGKTLRTPRKDIKKEPYYWVLTGLHLDCPAANLGKSDVTRFAQHLNYAHRHNVPPEYLIGFLLQSGSLADIYHRAKNPDHREQWFIDKANA
jgi:hypothetical protein